MEQAGYMTTVGKILFLIILVRKIMRSTLMILNSTRNRKRKHDQNTTKLNRNIGIRTNRYLLLLNFVYIKALFAKEMTL